MSRKVSLGSEFFKRAIPYCAGLVFAALASGARTLEPAKPPLAGKAVELARAYLRAYAEEFGVGPEDVAEAVVTDVVASPHNGLTHVYLRQAVAGREVRGAELALHFDSRGRVVYRTGRGVRHLASRVAEAAREPWLLPEEAIARAAALTGAPEVRSVTVLKVAGQDRYLFEVEGSFYEPVPVRLVYFRIPDSDQLVLAWNVAVAPRGFEDWWELWLDAVSGEELGRVNWTAHASYRVFALPKESPSDGARTDEVDPHLLGGSASPFGWHDWDGVTGPETTLTDGNNVEACADTDQDNLCDSGSLPDGTSSLEFHLPMDLATQQPAAYLPAAVVNLYYWNNVLHDLLYQYGFDEAAGNFQHNNYGRGGMGNDRVRAEAQDGSGTNNANFATPPDGFRPRMQLFVWTAPKALVVNSPPAIAGSYPAGTASFGPQTYNLTRNVVLVNDGSGTVTNDGCCNDNNTPCSNPIWPGITGVNPKPIAILYRGQCEFGTKVVNAQNAGAGGAIIINNQSNDPMNMGPGANGGSATIPALSLGLANGNLLVSNLPGVNVTMNSTATLGPDRDSDLDAGIIAHEYGHGVSNRLTGGPSTTGCLGNVEQMGEGWSDWMTLFLHARPTDTRSTPRPIGTYVTFGNRDTSVGIRRYPYSTETSVNPLTYGSVADTANSVPHGIGTIWATMLWEMYWNLVDVYGWDPDLYNGNGGNNIAFQLVLDGMKLQPCSPGFVDGRNAILAADVANYEGENRCEIWRAFAKRGLGVNANQGSSNNRFDGVEDFTLPPDCQGLIFKDGFGMGNTSRWSQTVP